MLSLEDFEELPTFYRNRAFPKALKSNPYVTQLNLLLCLKFCSNITSKHNQLLQDLPIYNTTYWNFRKNPTVLHTISVEF